jgi:uncharacterized membrane protein YphA (DoxX/SURF4 family)
LTSAAAVLIRITAILRISIGAGFLWSGASLLRDSALLYGGLLNALEQYGKPFPFYESFLSRFVELHQEFFAFGVAVGELLIGISFLTGALVSLSALAGAILVLNFAFATSYGDLPRMLLNLASALAFLLFGRLGAGLTWGLDGWLVRHIHEAIVLFPLRRSLPNF